MVKLCIFLTIVATALAAKDFEPQCDQGPDVGLCKGFFPMWWFNTKTGKCEEFVYGGCGGNGNRYETREECEETCSSKTLTSRKEETAAASTVATEDFHSATVAEVCRRPASSGPCLAYLPRFYYDPQRNSCRPFIYGGCKSNGNNFETLHACIEFCA
nr:kunitz-type serine protease inhibitor 6-like [Rhipicephalus microplus]